MGGRLRGPRVAVVGGGVLGVSTAAHLARRGADVTLLTEHDLGGGASGRSLSWLNSSGRYSPAYHRLRLLGLDRYRALAADPDCAGWLRFDGALGWAAPGETAGRRAAFEHLRQVGYPAEWLGRAEVAARTPGVDVQALPEDGALFTPGEGWVELRPLIGRLAAEVVARGGRMIPGAGHCELEVTGRGITGVRTGTGDRIAVDVAVLATGAAVPGAVARLGVHLPDATSTGLLVRTAPVRTRLRAVLNTPRVSVRPAPGGALALDAGWSEAEVVAREDGTYDVRRSTVEGLLRAASAVLEGGPELTAASWGAGPKPVPGDGEPVLGALDGVDGCVVAFTHSGATLALVVGELLADEVVDGRSSALLDPFRPGRFVRRHASG